MEAEREDRKQRVAMREEERKRIDEQRKIEEEKLVCTFGCDYWSLKLEWIYFLPPYLDGYTNVV